MFVDMSYNEYLRAASMVSSICSYVSKYVSYLCNVDMYKRNISVIEKQGWHNLCFTWTLDI